MCIGRARDSRSVLLHHLHSSSPQVSEFVFIPISTSIVVVPKNSTTTTTSIITICPLAALLGSGYNYYNTNNHLDPSVHTHTGAATTTTTTTTTTSITGMFKAFTNELKKELQHAAEGAIKDALSGGKSSGGGSTSSSTTSSSHPPAVPFSSDCS